MNFSGIDTCVCYASVAKNADARASQICPRPEGRRMSPIGTKLPIQNVRVESKRVDRFASMSDVELEAYVNGDRGLEH